MNDEAPTFAELLSKHGVPRHLHRQARAAMLEWLASWRYSTPTGADGDETVRYLRRMAGQGS